MKKYLFYYFLLMSFLANTTQAQPIKYRASHNSDILVYSKLERKWNMLMLQEFRTFMNNLAMNVDPLEYTYQTPIIYDEKSIKDFVSNDALILIEKVEKASGIDILDVHPELIIHNVGYKIDKIVPIGKVEENAQGDVTFKADITLSGLEVFADDIALTFLLDSTVDGKRIPTLNVQVNQPQLKILNGLELNFKIDVTVKEENDYLRLEFSNGDFSQIFTSMKNNPDSFQIQYHDISVPDVSLRLMGRDLSINSRKIKEVIHNHRPSLQAIMLKQVISLIESDGIMNSLKKISKKKIQKGHWVNTTSPDSIASFIQMQDLKAIGNGILHMELDGDFCTTENYQKNENDCVEYKKTAVTKSTISNADTSYSKIFALDKMRDKDIQFIASLSEDYVNKLIATTIEAGYWKEIEETIGFELGDRGAFVKFNKKGDVASVYIDVIYDSGLLTGLLLNKRYVRFPVVLKVKGRIENQKTISEDIITGQIVEQDLPHLVFNVFDVDLDPNKMKYGISEFDLPSNITEVRKSLQKMVLKKIQNTLFDYNAPHDEMRFKNWKGYDLPGLLFPELSNLQLENVITESDRHGRLLLMLRSKDLDLQAD